MITDVQSLVELTQINTDKGEAGLRVVNSKRPLKQQGSLPTSGATGIADNHAGHPGHPAATRL